eukprot:TRINITY_DN123_c0_g2_i3.p1 TRINITY_DN123_c0_g2~~TRINITY_DN123_c0_g2_i3.p1  ORF type:complete len:413 (+),score=88.12 TRINITY_DN123_c0_g2_i3:169-1239(+)
MSVVMKGFYLTRRPAKSGFLGRKINAVSNGATVKMAKAGNWLPGTASPAWLDGSLPGDYGFDPLGFGQVPSNLSSGQTLGVKAQRFRGHTSPHRNVKDQPIFWIYFILQQSFQVNLQLILSVNMSVVMKGFYLTRRPAKSGFLGRKINAVSNGATVKMAKAGNWLPGTASPAWLDGSLPGDYGFDPLGFGQVPSNLSRFQEAEIMNGRWAMLAVAGGLTVEILGLGNWYDAPTWAVTGGKPTYFGIELPFNLGFLIAFEVFAMAGVEVLRGSQEDPEKRVYPGGAFDPAGFSKNADSFEMMKLKEVKNGRLAMLAITGFFAQHAATGKTPLQNLGDHLADAVANNFTTNGVSVPFL